MREKRVLRNLIKWIIILALLAFGFFSNREFMHDAFLEIKRTSNVKLVLCFLVANLYFVAEGFIIHLMTNAGPRGDGAHGITFLEGVSCSYMCAFYRLATLGSGNGIAQIYYYNIKGIDASTGTGMAIVQYTFQKIAIGVMGVLSFVILIAVGDSALLKYSRLMALGVVVISAISIFLFVIAVSDKVSSLVVRLVRASFKRRAKMQDRIDKMESAIGALQTEGRIIWKDKLLFISVFILDIVKFSCWYIIPGILFADVYDINPLVCLALMAVCNMLGGVMVAPSGIGTLDFVFALFFKTIVPSGKAVAAAILIYRFFTWAVPFMIGIVPAAFIRKKDK